MKSILLLISAIFIQSLCAAETSVKEEQYLAPSDIGAHKYTLTAKPAKNQVAVFSITRARTTGTGKIEDTHHIVRYGENMECSESICVINPDFFRPNREGKETWHIAGLRGSRWQPGRFKSVESGGHVVTFRFEEEEDVTVITIAVKILSLKEANEQYEGLPANTDHAWCWAGVPKTN